MAGKHHVVQGATVQCQFSLEPKTDVLKVKTHKIVSFNDKEGNDKFAATNKDIGQTLEKNTFGKCKKQPTGNGDFLPCQAIISEWTDFQELGSVGENKAKLLLEDSKATCPMGAPGCITIKNHGQTGEGNQEQVKQGNNNAQNQANPLFKDFVEEQTQAKAEPENMGPNQKREIVKVVMEDINGDSIPKGEKFSYGKVVNSVAHTTGMVGELLHFEMWEDDAIGAGHSDENRYNKVAEQFVVVGINGVAEVRFVISRTFSKIATAHNAYEGRTHEYYIIAYANETPVMASSNINIYAPEYKEEKKKVIIDKIKGIEPVGVQEPKQKIKAEAPKVIVPKVPHVPGTKRAAPPKPVVPKPGEPKKITYIFFTDDKNHKIVNAKYGDTIRAHIGSTGLIDHKVKIKAYDHEVMGENHFLGEVGNYTISANLCHVDIVLTKEMKEHGANLFSDEVYVDIEIMETKAHVVSTQIKVDTNNSIFEIARNITKAKVGVKREASKNNTTCACKELDLTWGGHPNINCDFRKKVVEISKRQNFDPNHLMAVMGAETERTFSTSLIQLMPTGKLRPDGKPKKEPRGLKEKEIKELPDGFEGAIGLIQFTPAAIKGLNDQYGYSLTKKKLAVMSQLVQLDYVEKYIELWKKINKVSTKLTLGDLYVLVFSPSKMNGSDDSTVLYQEGTEAYRKNASVDTVDGNSDGKITKKELSKRAYDSLTEGNLKANKETVFKCGNVVGNTGDTGFYIYRSGVIKYIEAKDKSIAYYVQVKDGSNDFRKINILSKNTSDLVKFPDSGSGFDRYGGVDTGGKSKVENVGAGDHYLLPQTAAALYGILNEIVDKKWEVHFGDMSSENGSDPTSTPSTASSHHAGHGHLGKQSGLNVDFRYLDTNGKSFQGLSSSDSFDDTKNKEFFKIAFKYGFNKNYATGKSYSGVNSRVGSHYDHGHLGTLEIDFETIKKIDVTIIK
jgi:Domain of unknown function (DUF4280)